ncbi:MAG: 2-hydroxyglutaryl-CoA dehydratase [Deltaproteobacteria bacterium]|nr:2-hydroxyglutaryl-CoA dehydratase [Deltaproteobacteria bacterium]
MIFAGCDVGSLTAKAVILMTNQDNKDPVVISSELMQVRPLPKQSATEIMQKALDDINISFEDIDACCSTGYGREEISFADFNISEISCHARGVYFIDPSIRALIDIGGQDLKAIRIDEKGRLLDFKMNNRCAAGTGRFLEISAQVLGISIEQLGPLSLQSKKNISVTGQCSIFAEMEVTHKLYRGVRRTDLAAAINKAMALRVSALAKKIVQGVPTCITGGVSKNIGVVNNLEKILGMSFKKIAFDPQMIGALGAALYAKEYFDKELPKQRKMRA